MKSIIQTDCDRCFLCGKNGLYDHLEKHHIFGAYNRKKSEEDGLFVYLCGNECHRNGKMSVHRNKDIMKQLHMVGQRAWEKHYGDRAAFMARYKKNYMEEL